MVPQLGDIENAASKVTDTVSGITGSIGDIIKKTGASASALLNSDTVTQISNAYGDTVQNFNVVTKAIDQTAGNTLKEIANIKDSVTKGLGDQISGFLQKAQELATTPLTFVSSVTKDAINAIDLKSITDNFSLDSLSNGQLGKLGNLGKDALSSASNALKGITSSLNDVKAAALGKVSEITKFVGDTASDIFKPAIDLASFGKEVLDPNNIHGIVKENLGFLPNVLTDKITNKIVDKTENLHRKFNVISGKLDNIENLASDLSDLSSLNSYDDRKVTDKFGNPIKGLSNTGSLDNLASLVSGAESICGKTGIDLDKLLDFDTNKDYYDVLVKNSLRDGSSSLLDSLLGCDTYYDNRTSTVVRNELENVAKRGDIDTFYSAIGDLDSSTAKNPKSALRTLVANMPYTTENATKLDDMLSKLNIAPKELLTTDYSDNLSSQNIALLSNKSTGFVDSVIQDLDRRNTVYQLQNQYCGF